MGRVYNDIDNALREFLCAQHVFFVGTAPLSATGHINVSPKGMDSFRVLDPKRVAYLDYPASGIETVAHLRENGRIVLMFCGFDGSPKVVRLYGKGRAVEPQEAEFSSLVTHFAPKFQLRSIVCVDLDRVA